MTKSLTIKTQQCYYYKDGKKIIGTHDKISGTINISGDTTNLEGDVSGLVGDVSGVSGNATGKVGDMSLCGLTEDEKSKLVSIEDLVKSKE